MRESRTRWQEMGPMVWLQHPSRPQLRLQKSRHPHNRMRPQQLGVLRCRRPNRTQTAWREGVGILLTAAILDRGNVSCMLLRLLEASKRVRMSRHPAGMTHAQCLQTESRPSRCESSKRARSLKVMTLRSRDSNAILLLVLLQTVRLRKALAVLLAGNCWKQARRPAQGANVPSVLQGPRAVLVPQRVEQAVGMKPPRLGS